MERIDKIDPSRWRNDSFLAEEVLIPWTSHTDPSRLLMATAQLAQCVVPCAAEFPRVFTGYENQVGKWSSSYLKSDRDWEVVAVVRKNDFHAAVVLRDPADGSAHVVRRRPCRGLSEGFGEAFESPGLDAAHPGGKIGKGEVLFRSTAYSEPLPGSLLFGFGTNLRVAYLPWHGLTHEDGIVVSESAAERLAAWAVDELVVSVNNNDLLLNLYGDQQTYRAFPEVGEEVKSGVLCARRRIHHESVLRDLAAAQLTRPSDGDVLFYTEGTVVDVEVFSNAPPGELERHEHYNGQVARYLAQERAFWTELKDVLDPWVKDKKAPYSDDAAYAWARARDWLDPDVSWRSGPGASSAFDNYQVRFTVLRRAPLSRGSKLTNRFGGKGVVSEILPDDQMPRVEGTDLRADAIVNPLGIINRLNPAQVMEQEVSMVADQVSARMAAASDDGEKAEELLAFLRIVSPGYAADVETFLGSAEPDEVEAFLEDCSRDRGIHVRMPPFHGCLDIEGLARLYRELPWAGPYSFEGIEGPVCMGDVYYLRLRHEPRDKFSARSSSFLNPKGAPSKSSKFRHGQQPYSKTPIRCGEMELFNLLAAAPPEEVTRIIAQYSSVEADRAALIEALLTKNPLDLPDVPRSGERGAVRDALDAYLRGMGLELVSSPSQ